METLCACEFPQAVNNCDERYHCDCCGYPLQVDDRRHEFVRRFGLEYWGLIARNSLRWRYAEDAWAALDGVPKPPDWWYDSALIREYAYPPLIRNIRLRWRE